MTVYMELKIREDRVGMTAALKRGLQCIHQPFGGLTKQMYLFI
jgi:hypothetical protein